MMQLSSIQKMEIGITALLFCIFVLIIRPLIVSGEINSVHIIAYTLIFIAWYGCTYIFTNQFYKYFDYDKYI